MAAPSTSYEDAPVWQQPQDQKGPEENSHQNMGYAQTSMAGTAGAPPPQQTSIQATPGTPGPDLTQGGTVSMPGQESSSPGPDLTNGGTTQMPSQGSGWSSPFGQMNFANNQPKPYAHGGVVTKPTLALLGEDGAEAVVPMGNNPNAHITPGMLAPRYDTQTGPSSLRHPMGNLKPVSGPMAHSATNWKRYAHPHAR